MPNNLQTARIQTVKDHMALECLHEWEKVLDTFELPRYEMHSSGAIFEGKEEVMGYFLSSRDAFPDLINEIITIAIADDSNTALVEFWLQGTHLGSFCVNGKTYEPTGRQFRVRMAASFEFASGSDKILCERPYSCQDAKLRALGFL